MVGLTHMLFLIGDCGNANLPTRELCNSIDGHFTILSLTEVRWGDPSFNFVAIYKIVILLRTINVDNRNTVQIELRVKVLLLGS